VYLRHFGFDEAPFSITPDHRFVYLSPQHEESLAHLIYGVQRGGGAGFVLLTGEVGTGKTTLSRLLLEQPVNDNEQRLKIALLLNPRLSPQELLENILRELGIPLRGVSGQLNRMVNRLNEYLLKTWAQGQNTVVLIDEAQNLPPETLEQLRLLTNLETDKHKLLQVILIGQPELRETLRRTDLRQLAQRITARYHLRELNAEETARYIAHRCAVAGAKKNPFSTAACKALYRFSHGTPRLINTLADRALLVAWNAESPQVSASHVKQAASEVLDAASQGQSHHRLRWLALAAGLVGLIGLIGLTWLVWQGRGQMFPEKTVSTASSESINHTQPVSAIPQSGKSTLPEKDWPDALQAWRQYAAVWSSHAGGWDKAQCPPPQVTGMACLRRQGNLAQIRRLNRPVLLQTTVPEKLLLLEKITPDHRLLLRSNQENPQAVDSQWLEQHWLGTYYVLWPLPAELLGTAATDSAAWRHWARQLAEQISQQKFASDAAFTSWLKAFQRRHGLLADGIIGPETAMALSLKGYTGPQLNGND
jgi:general secretion pathway protein A